MQHPLCTKSSAEMGETMPETKNQIILISIIIIASILFLLSLCKRKGETILNFILRIVFGIIFIYAINKGLVYFGLSIGVGINEISLITVGLLGFPGFVLLYAVSAYFYFLPR